MTAGALGPVCEGKEFNFPAEELKTLEFWDRTDAFKEQLRRTEGRKEFVFYDGPPFATGLPHYGHILAGSIKDIVTRYASQTGRHVTRRFGWDCHGLPVEYEIDKKLGIKSREDVLKMGIDKYNEECRSIVMRYSGEWEKTVHRLGRWIDFENDYKTLDPSFMESVWWAFSQLYEKGLVYRGFKVMPYSTACTTTLSNFEAGLNYKDVDDPAVTVGFQLDDDPDNALVVAWTTTPWTLPSNMALCVHPDMIYVRVKNPATGSVYIILEARLAELPGAVPKASKKKKGKADAPEQPPFEVLAKFPGKELEGKTYAPLFPYFARFKQQTRAFRILCDSYVKADSGTGIVHNAPAFGEDDYRICIENGIVEKGGELPCPLDADGCFTEEVPDFQSLFVKDADKPIIAKLKEAGRIVHVAVEHHSYPFCWRSDTPLIYKAVPSWFVRVTAIKDRLVANNALTDWVPTYVKEKRFHNWLQDANDWAISRSRFWGTPLPIWASEDGKEVIVVSSKAQLEELTGAKVEDLHRHFIDDLTIPSREGHGVLRRDDAVFDCWFESGSMPYAQNHYPFENKEVFQENFPADFVAEGLDQTRGWFYTLMVLSTALFDKPAFKNLVCNGLVLASDGKKMSKRLQNYPDPVLVISKYGADALRLYLINSPVVRAESLRFEEAGVYAIVKDVFLPWYNAYRFLVQNVQRWEQDTRRAFQPSQAISGAATNVLDRWILASTRLLTNFVRKEMDAYHLYTVVPYLVRFIDQLTNIYVRYNRKRLKGKLGDQDTLTALSTLYSTLLTLCKVMAPFTPFLTEHMYQNLRRCQPGASAADSTDSVHFCDIPAAMEESAADQHIQQSVQRMQQVIEMGRLIRDQQKKPLKVPLRAMVIVHTEASFLEQMTGELREYVVEELNVRTLETCDQPLKYAQLRADPDWKLIGERLGKTLGKDMKTVAAAIRAMTSEQIAEYERERRISLDGQTFIEGEIKILRDFKAPEGVAPGEMEAAGDGELLCVLDLRPEAGLAVTGLARELLNRVQKLRKRAGLVATDAVDIFLRAASEEDSKLLLSVINSEAELIRSTLRTIPQPAASMPPDADVIAEDASVLKSAELSCTVAVVLVRPKRSSASGGTGTAANGVAASLGGLLL